MKNFFKIFLFFMIIFLSPKVFAASQNISSKVEAIPNFGGGTYYATQPAAVPVPLYQNIGTRYNGKLSLIEFYLDNSDWDWNYNKTYTITLNMATEDWRNNFMGPQIIQCNCDGSQQSTSSSSYVNNTFRFVSYKTIKFNFKLGSTMGCKTKFRLYSGNTSSTAITGVSNYNLSSIVITDTISPPTPTPVAPVPTPTSTASNQDIINNQSQNTQDIIDNNTQNTADIIENNNQNTQNIIDNQKELLSDCLKNEISLNIVSLGGRTYNYPLNLITGKTYNISSNAGIAVCIHNGNFNCVNELIFNNYGGGSYSSNYNITATSNSLYLSISSGSGWGNYNITASETMLSLGSGRKSFVPYGEEQCNSKIDNSTNAINDVNNSINNSNVDNNVGTDFFNDFEDNSHGLTGIITAPLTAIQRITSSTCQPLTIPIPFTDGSVNLPCMTEIYEQNIPTIYNIWKIVSFGIIAYFICIDIFHIVKGFKDPETDKVEVLDL